ncbi:hypothetical protein [Bacillus massilinigeriensis]|uniref:hypothetical protein n=1 Tax=Bacillus mediterraneensis TaxID=1805474 RepID=UPI0013567315|nr:hypothetical protein [Bacillus mediterraneensis]
MFEPALDYTRIHKAIVRMKEMTEENGTEPSVSWRLEMAEDEWRKATTYRLSSPIRI